MAKRHPPKPAARAPRGIVAKQAAQITALHFDGLQRENAIQDLTAQVGKLESDLKYAARINANRAADVAVLSQDLQIANGTIASQARLIGFLESERNERQQADIRKLHRDAESNRDTCNAATDGATQLARSSVEHLR